MVRSKTTFFRNSKLDEIKKLVEIAEGLAKSHDDLEERVADLEKQLEGVDRTSAHPLFAD
jgi:hypothetical protein